MSEGAAWQLLPKGGDSSLFQTMQNSTFSLPPRIQTAITSAVRKTLLSGLLLSAVCGANTVRAAAVINGDFETGDFTGWTTYVTANGTAGTGYPAVVDTDPSAAVNWAAAFHVGSTVTGTPGGAGISQTVSLLDGDYAFSLDVSALGGATANGDAGTFSLLFDGQLQGTLSLGPINPGELKTGVLSGNLAGVSAGSHLFQVEITRSFTSTTNSPLQYVDNVALTDAASLPEPSELALWGVGAMMIAWQMRRR